MNDYWNSVKHITLPVKRVDGRWELLYGGDTGVRDGTQGELRVPVSCIENEDIRKRLTRTVTVKVLDEGTELLVALADRDYRIQAADLSILDNSLIDPADLPQGCTRLERIQIGPVSPATRTIDAKRGGLWIRQRGVDRTELVCSGIRMPQAFEPAQAHSLNHACTLLSERYEKHRISHTRNVYTHVFYREGRIPTPRWLPIDVLRNGVIADMERGIVAEAWSNLEKLLGFRPVGKSTVEQRPRNRR